MADSMAQLMAQHAARIGWFMFGAGIAGYLASGDDRYLATGIATAVGALAIYVVGGLVAARRVADDDQDATLDDLFAADAEALDRLADPLADRGDLELVDALEVLEPLFEELDGNPLARTFGTRARLAGRTRLPVHQRRAWAAIVSMLESPDQVDAARCTCGVMSGVLTPSRSCPFHGRHAW